MEKKKKAALYTRVSTVHQVDKDSLPHQKHALTEYIKYVLHIEDYEIFEDAGFSGKNTNRPAYQEMMMRIRAGEFTHLVVNKIDRISRNLLDFAAMYEELKKYNVVFVSCNEQFDTSNAMGEAMLKIILVFAELERHMTSERVTAVMMDRARKGIRNGSFLPLGYRWSQDKKFIQIDEQEAKTTKLIFSMYLDGMSTTKIARFLNAHSITGKKGGCWNSATVRQILVNPIYKGTFLYNYRTSKSGATRKRPSNDWVVIDDNHPALISPEKWEKVKAMLKKNRLTNNIKHGRHTHVFMDISYCICGHRLYSKLGRQSIRTDYQPTYYGCANYLYRVGMKDRCDNNRCMGDGFLGTFLLVYMRNMIQVQQNISPDTTREEMEKALLNGLDKYEIKKIAADSLEDIYRSFMCQANIEYIPKEQPDYLEKENSHLKEKLEKEKVKHERALERLNHAYLYNDVEIPSDTFFLERKKIIQKLSDVKSKLRELDQHIEKKEDDYAFLEQASDYLIKKCLLSSDPINWVELALHVDVSVLHQFFLATIERITSYKAKIIYIKFKNGIVHHFIYDSTES